MELLYNLERGNKHHKLLIFIPLEEKVGRKLGSARPKGKEGEESNVILYKESRKAFLLRYLSRYLKDVSEEMSLSMQIDIWGKEMNRQKE